MMLFRRHRDEMARIQRHVDAYEAGIRRRDAYLEQASRITFDLDIGPLNLEGDGFAAWFRALPKWQPNRAYSEGTFLSVDGLPFLRIHTRELGMESNTETTGLVWDATERRHWQPIRFLRKVGDEIDAWTEAWDPATGEWHELRSAP